MRCGADFRLRCDPALHHRVDYSDIRLPCGWRGPYLRLARPIDGVYDGWGDSFVSVTTTIHDVPQVAGVQWNPRPSYDVLQSDRSHAMVTVSGVLTQNDEPATGSVVLLYPEPTESTGRDVRR